MFWRPPTSPLSRSSTAETVTAPSWDASAPTPSPASSIGTVTTSGPAPSSIAAASDTIPASRAARPHVTTRRGLASGHSFGTPTAAASSVIESGSSRTPVSTALSPSATDRNSGTVKNSPAWSRNWKKNMVSPPVSWALLNRIATSTRGSRPTFLQCSSHWKNSRTARPARRGSSTRVIERPARSGASGLGRHPAPLARPEHAVHREAEAGGGQQRADHVEPDRHPRGGVLPAT